VAAPSGERPGTARFAIAFAHWHTARLMIRLLEPADDASYRTLWSEAITQYGEHFRTALEDAAPAGIPTSFQPDSYTLGAFEGGKLIGVVSVAREQGAKLRHKALLSRMFIHPDAAGLGLGKLMLHETIMLAVSVPDLRQIYLTVLETNEPAQRLYAAAGFRSYSHEPDAVKIGDAFVAELQMVRFLRRDARG
jgi:RimJ/RimL family protein N-acetyltransferase